MFAICVSSPMNVVGISLYGLYNEADGSIVGKTGEAQHEYTWCPTKMKGSGKRPYTLKARARRRDEVHLRITKATVHLHGTVGPARTTVSDIAKIAGVRRATVYNHFPTDRDLLDACSSHWFADNPPPDPGHGWRSRSRQSDRRGAGSHFTHTTTTGKEMLEKVLRDGPLVPALDEILRQKWWPMMEGIVDILAQGWENAGPDTNTTNVALRASLNVALDFFTWKTLTSSGLSSEGAARLAAAWIRTASSKFGAGENDHTD